MSKFDAVKHEIAHSSPPPGKIKIVAALKALLREKEFSAVTWSEIARTAGVTEGLIYKYFKDRRNLLYHVLEELLDAYATQLDHDLEGVEGAFKRLRKLIWSSVNFYNSDRVFSRILLLEVRSFSDYYESPPYRLVRDYARIVLEIVEEGRRSGEIRRDVPAKHIRQIILGGIEHLCLPGLIYDKDMMPDVLTEEMCTALFKGIAGNRSCDER